MILSALLNNRSEVVLVAATHKYSLATQAKKNRVHHTSSATIVDRLQHQLVVH